MGRYICLECGETYSENFQPQKYNIPGYKFEVAYCPKYNCEGCVVEIDDNMIGIVLELNKMGLFSNYCCGGHVGADETDVYIAFSPDIEAHMLGDIPEGFELEDKDVVFDKVCIRHTIKDHNIPHDLLWQQREINKYIDILTKWVEERRLHFDAYEC